MNPPRGCLVRTKPGEVTAFAVCLGGTALRKGGDSESPQTSDRLLFYSPGPGIGV